MAQEVLRKKLHTNDVSLMLYTRNGIADYSTVGSAGKTLTLTNAIVGNGIVFTSGSMTWGVVPLTTVIYTFDSGSGVNHYAIADGVKYLNGVVDVSTFPITVTSTGISGVTGKLHSLSIFNEVKSASYIDLDYENESKYW